MRKTLLCALAALACACSDGKRDGKMIEVFQRHSLEAHDPARLRAELSARGPAGLKLFDPYAALVGARPRVAAAAALSPAPSTGLLLGPCGARVCALRVLRGSPADKAGMKDFDRLLAASGAGPSPEAILPVFAREPRELVLKAERMRRPGELSFALKPAGFRPPGIFGFYDPSASAAYVRLPSFPAGAAGLVESGLASMKAYGFRRIVLDLRYNRGGLPREAAAVFALFAARGRPCFSINSRHEGYNMTFPPGKGGPYAGVPLAVLVNDETAMAAEALAAALREGAGARLYGAKTKGSATVVKTFRLDGRGGLRLAVARFLAPSGAALEGAGLEPDVAVPPAGPAFHEDWLRPAETLLYRDAAWLAAVGRAGRG